MKLILLCIGSLKPGPEKDLLNQYRNRVSWPLEIKEIVCKRPGTLNQVKSWEGKLLVSVLESNSSVIGLDEKGILFTSIEFAQILKNYHNEGVKSLTFIIGGTEGLSKEITDRCQHLISFGRMTWPHLLVRGMLLEQIYRAQQILLGHPYHRV